MITDEQIRLFRRKRIQGKTQEAAAAAAGITAKTARPWEAGPLPSSTRVPHDWRTRPDPFTKVWGSHVLPLLVADKKGKLQAKTVLKELREQFPGEFPYGQIRTLQRRIRDWRALEGPAKEVFFEQEHPPGREAQFDFTDAAELEVTIAGSPLAHLVFEFILSASKWRYGEIAFGETFEAMSSGLQGAVLTLGATPHVWRSDNLSAATHQIKKDQPGRTLTERYRQLTEHYQVESTRIKPGKSNENGSVEKGHHILKSALEQSLILRGSRDFLTLEAYRDFVEAVVTELNEPCMERLALERPHLKQLPPAPIPAFSDVRAKVHRSSCIRVGNNTYMVPSRLIDHEIVVRVHPDEIEIIYRDQVVARFERLRGEGKHRINYRYIIDSLVAKPGAFARYRYREELFPTLNFRRAYDAIHAVRGSRADVEYVRILHLAAKKMESEVDLALQILLENGTPFDYAAVQALVEPHAREISIIISPLVPDLDQYAILLNGAFHDQYPDTPTLSN